MSIIYQIEQELIDTEKDRYRDRIGYLENLYHDNSQITNGVNAVMNNSAHADSRRDGYSLIE